jgi:hypothetical protein
MVSGAMLTAACVMSLGCHSPPTSKIAEADIQVAADRRVAAAEKVCEIHDRLVVGGEALSPNFIQRLFTAQYNLARASSDAARTLPEKRAAWTKYGEYAKGWHTLTVKHWQGDISFEQRALFDWALSEAEFELAKLWGG